MFFINENKMPQESEMNRIPFVCPFMYSAYPCPYMMAGEMHKGPVMPYCGTVYGGMMPESRYGGYGYVPFPEDQECSE